MRRLPPHLAPLGYSPRRYAPLSPAPVLGMGERLTDLRDIQQMFANGELGGYWPADPQYAYEDSAGTTLASVNGVVGLRLDISQSPPSIWVDKIENGSDFSSWTNGIFDCHVKPTVTSNTAIAPDGTLSADTLTSTHISASTIGSNFINAAANKTYQLSCWIKSTNVVNCRLNIAYGKLPYNPLDYIVDYIDSYDKNIVITSNWGKITWTYTLPNNTEIKAVQGNVSFTSGYEQNPIGSTMDVWGATLVDFGASAIQSTTANKPYLRRTPTTGKYWYDSNTYTGALTAAFPSSLGSSCTIASVTPEGVSILENQTVGSTYNICPPFDYNGDVLIINRALTAAEKALVTRVMQRSVPSISLLKAAAFNSLADWEYTTDCTVSDQSLIVVPNPNATWRYPITADYNYVFVSGNQYIFKWAKIGGMSDLFGIGLYGRAVISGKTGKGTFFQAYTANSNFNCALQFKTPYTATFNKLEQYRLL